MPHPFPSFHPTACSCCFWPLHHQRCCSHISCLFASRLFPMHARQLWTCALSIGSRWKWHVGRAARQAAAIYCINSLLCVLVQNFETAGGRASDRGRLRKREGREGGREREESVSSCSLTYSGAGRKQPSDGSAAWWCRYGFSLSLLHASRICFNNI